MFFLEPRHARIERVLSPSRNRTNITRELSMRGFLEIRLSARYAFLSGRAGKLALVIDCAFDAPAREAVDNKCRDTQ
jgi:hypothetical protein